MQPQTIEISSRKYRGRIPKPGQPITIKIPMALYTWLSVYSDELEKSKTEVILDALRLVRRQEQINRK